MHCVDNFIKLPTVAPKMFGAWANSGSCEGAAANPHCGPGTQSQTRTCTDGTIDHCESTDTSRVVSCVTSGTELPVCGKYVTDHTYMIHTTHEIFFYFDEGPKTFSAKVHIKNSFQIVLVLTI